jgi:hypothetical protein
LQEKEKKRKEKTKCDIKNSCLVALKHFSKMVLKARFILIGFLTNNFQRSIISEFRKTQIFVFQGCFKNEEST